MWADSLARSADGWMDALAARLEDARHRVLGQPVDLEIGVKAYAARRRSRRRARRGRGRSARRCRAPAWAGCDRASSAGPVPAQRAAPLGRRRVSTRFVPHRIAGLRRVAGPLEAEVPEAHRAGRPPRRRRASTRSSSVPCTTRPGHVIPRACSCAVLAVDHLRVPAREAQEQRLGVGLERPADARPRSASWSAAR